MEDKVDTIRNQTDTSAWVFQCWASFLVSLSAMMAGVAYLPGDMWVKGFLAMGTLFLVGSTFTLAKTVRDNHEAQRLLNRVKTAKTERLIREFEEPT